ncbi:penicillin-binding transpeptidase domain-containing protein [Cytobacillus purgationiresistens]|uniref:serine-type D-Ala-D-Ala carboxypeptidase n=1 Tax=Cytobacillus purgationiresistens TaxID=863449 RepID=A0ABU0AEA6_9BACI|nr:penicillin-binding transpeptidase domain-containing protein [Cytobacillus purgationiresistens]MDQ0269209.1 penicillin-binding protein [Cytobacillus purgationiresistens]
MRKIIFFSVSILFLVVLSACNKEVKPEDRFSQYIEHWNKQDFDKMYRLLSAEAKESISKEDYIARYEKVYKDLEITDLVLTYKIDEENKIDKNEKIVDLPFSAKMNSAAGEIKFTHEATLVKEEIDKEENWYVDWNSTYIFPDLGPKDKISYSNVPAQRGEIIDRTGDVLAFNGTIYQIGVVPQQMGDQTDSVVQGLSDLLGISVDGINKTLEADWVQPEHFVPIKKVSPDNKQLLEKLFALPGVQKQDVKGRVYPAGEAATHLVGYVTPINADDLEKNKGKGYSSNDIIGRKGLESVYEEQLRGTNGVKIGITKEDGSEVTLAEKPVENGENVQLTIDLTLQEQLYKKLDGKAGTAAAIDPVSGATLALVSSPSFDPNEASLGLTEGEWRDLENDSEKPLINRFQHTYAPGSVIKPITGSIALKEGTLTLDETKNIKGLKWGNGNSWGSYKVTRVSDPGKPVNFDLAMMISDNIYFAQAAMDLGKDKFSAGLKEFGFEEDMPFDFPLESSKIGELDTEILLADSGYGQGHVEMNILHLATAYTPFINKGAMIKPVLLESDEKGQVWKDNVISEDLAKSVETAMNKVVHEQGGTARAARIDDYPLAGKTGTAELKLSESEEGQENGLFVAYNPENPKLLISMMIESVEKQGGSKIVVERVKETFEANKDRFK